MPTVTMTVRGSEQLRRNLARLAGNERRQAQADGLEAGARVLETYVKVSISGQSPSAPGHPPGLDTVFLRNSIQVDGVTPNQALLTVGAEYGESLEFGTEQVAARPYMRPALDQHEREIVGAIEATVAAFVDGVRA